MIRKRPLIAVTLAFIYPGLGHAYLRRWMRALMWFGLVVTAAVFVVPPATVEGSESIVATSRAMYEQMSTLEQMSLVAIHVINMLDAYTLANDAEPRRRGDARPACPYCGKELDEDLDFCHWCTSELDVPGDEERA